MPYTDKTLACVDCGSEFIFSAEDQQYHADRGFMNEPRRCRSCRAVRRLSATAKTSASGTASAASYSAPLARRAEKRRGFLSSHGR